MRVPANIIEAKYTAGNEFVFTLNYKYYQGYYYELNGKTFVGKEFNANSPELIRSNSSNVNTLLTNSKTYIYGFISGVKSSQLLSPKFNPIPKTNLDIDTEGDETYYSKKLNNNPILIKQINKKTFDELKQNPFYQVISLKPNRSDLDQVDKQMPGLKSFLLG